ncbi:expansin-like B1 [Cucurbita maxima]|uniref:Expansin-like B1 n=1 Tax=Cucurbita maxima TaxID=3661 RepID=A0A6J1I6V7_CUCMA|nr:expansin-like B1 [Cucurbita maxima]
MEISVKCPIFGCLLLVLLPMLCSSQDNFVYSRATYYGSPDCYGTPSGACGFGDFGRTVNDGNVAAVSYLYRNGSGCGACYQVRCTNPTYCSDSGAYVVVTDHGEGDYTDFILSPRAFAKLAHPNTAFELFSYGVVDVQFRRVSCQYPNYNTVKFKVHEHSRYPDYLAIVIIYVGGQNDITVVELWQEDCNEWKGMRRSHGAVWDMANPPKGDIKLRFQVSGSVGYGRWVMVTNALPSYWKAGIAYDTDIHLY